MVPHLRPRHASRRLGACLLGGILVLSIPLSVAAQTGPAMTGPAAGGTAQPKAPKPYQGPLDTIMSSHLWTEVPTPQDFVTATHRDPKSLQFTPLTGKDPERPKPRDAGGIAALQAELEHDGQMNERKAKGLGGVTKAGIVKVAKRKARKAEKVSSTAE